MLAQTETQSSEWKWRRGSQVWLYLMRIYADNASWDICNKSFACKRGNTSNLSKLQAKPHHIQMEECTVWQPSLYFSHFPTYLRYVMLAEAHTEIFKEHTWVDSRYLPLLSWMFSYAVMNSVWHGISIIQTRVCVIIWVLLGSLW